MHNAETGRSKTLRHGIMLDHIIRHIARHVCSDILSEGIFVHIYTKEIL